MTNNIYKKTKYMRNKSKNLYKSTKTLKRLKNIHKNKMNKTIGPYSTFTNNIDVLGKKTFCVFFLITSGRQCN